MINSISMDSEITVDEHQARRLSKPNILEVKSILCYQLSNINAAIKKKPTQSDRRKRVALVRMVEMIDRVLVDKKYDSKLSKSIRHDLHQKEKTLEAKERKRKSKLRKDKHRTVSEIFVDMARDELSEDQFRRILDQSILRAKEFQDVGFFSGAGE